VPALGITGGIATGKSTFSEAFCRHLSAELFDADQCSRDLLANDATVRTAVQEAFGPRAFGPTGQPDRVWLREAVFADASKRRQLEQILHPAIRTAWVIRAADAAATGKWLCVDIPLLYETGAQSQFAAVIVVACSAATQRARLLEKRQLSATIADQILAAQLDLATKIAQADHLIWNDSSNSCLDRQARLLAGALRQRFRCSRRDDG
jgi:dephospho-CoA kinase